MPEPQPGQAVWSIICRFFGYTAVATVPALHNFGSDEGAELDTGLQAAFDHQLGGADGEPLGLVTGEEENR